KRFWSRVMMHPRGQRWRKVRGVNKKAILLRRRQGRQGHLRDVLAAMMIVDFGLDREQPPAAIRVEGYAYRSDGSAGALGAIELVDVPEQRFLQRVGQRLVFNVATTEFASPLRRVLDALGFKLGNRGLCQKKEKCEHDRRS